MHVALSIRFHRNGWGPLSCGFFSEVFASFLERGVYSSSIKYILNKENTESEHLSSSHTNGPPAECDGMEYNALCNRIIGMRLAFILDGCCMF